MRAAAAAAAVAAAFVGNEPVCTAAAIIRGGAGGAIREKYACEWFDESHHADPSGDCMIIDDQFALIPPHLAPFCEY